MEIERKFLVANQEYKSEAFEKDLIVQGFLNTEPERTVRVRVIKGQGIITVKGKTSKSGTTRQEWEFGIGQDEAKELLTICKMPLIEKVRYQVRCGSHLFEVDEFHGVNEGLVIAEVELQTEEEIFVKPPWLGDEVTGDPKYYNTQLSKSPFKVWRH